MTGQGLNRALRLLILAGAIAAGGCGLFDKKAGPPPVPTFEPSMTLNSAWSYGIGSAGVYSLTPAKAEGAVFVAAYNGKIARLEAGKEVWAAAAKAKISAGVGVGAGRLAVGTEKGEVIAFDLAGKELWRAKVSSEVLAAPALNGKLVLVRTTDNRIHALSAEDGKRRWVYQRSAPPLVMRNAGAVILTDNVAYAGFSGGKLVALDLNNGAAIWEATIALPRGATELERVADVTGEPVIAGRSVCAIAYQGRLGCVDRQSGATVWGRDFSGATGLSLEGRSIYLSDQRGNVFALDAATGATLWRQDKLMGREPSRPVPTAHGVVVVDGKGVIYLLSATDGSLAAIDKRGGETASAPLALDEQFLVQDTGGTVRALVAKGASAHSAR